MAKKHDIHPAEIIAMLHKKKTSMAAVSRHAGLSSSTLSQVLRCPWPKGEFLVANALGIHPSEIWPSRYFDSEGKLIERQNRIRKKQVNDLSISLR